MRSLHRLGRLAGLTAVLSVLFAVAWPALAAAAAPAYIGQRGDPHPLGIVNIILIFVVAPIGVFLVVSALCLRPQRGVGSMRYRPGRSWGYPPAWFGTRAPVEIDPEQTSSTVGAGGASASW